MNDIIGLAAGSAECIGVIGVNCMISNHSGGGLNHFAKQGSLIIFRNIPIAKFPIPIRINLNNFTNLLVDNFLIYPNPAKNEISITDKNNHSISSISFYNILGQLIQTNTNPTNTIDVSNLKSGSYFLKIVSEKGVSSTKFIKE